MSEIDLEWMDTFFSEITHNGSRCSQEFANWGEWHLDNWKAIKAEVVRLRARVKELEAANEMLMADASKALIQALVHNDTQRKTKE